MTQLNSAISSFANRKENGDSLAKEPAPTLDSALGRCWAGLLLATALARAALGRFVAASLSLFPKSFSKLVFELTCKFKIKLCSSPKIVKLILLDS
jgi:hypothetical protein